MTVRTARTTSGIGMYFGWAAVGACASVGLLTPFTIGPFVLTAAVIGAALLAWRRGLGISCAGLLSGAGLAPLYVGYLNRNGPGQVCSTNATGQSCISEWSPWPWLVAGVLLIAVGTGAYLALRRQVRRAG